MPGTRVATVQIWVKAGSVYENAEEAGITHFIEHMIFKGTETRGPGELAGAIEGVGGRVNAYTSYEYTVYHATLSAVHWDMALEVLAEAVMHSVFDPVELEREKKVVLEEVSMRYDRPNIRLFHELMATAYTRHPYRLPVIGNEESINNFSRDKILAVYPETLLSPESDGGCGGRCQGRGMLSQGLMKSWAVWPGAKSRLQPCLLNRCRRKHDFLP